MVLLRGVLLLRDEIVMEIACTKPRLLECTLRDGSYAVNFQFTKQDTANIVRALETVGFDMIEVGHGVGLGASEKTNQVAAETDEAYLKVTAETVKNADWGMFCIPGIADLSHVHMSANYGMKFIRIGCNVEEYEKTKPFIECAKKYGMLVCTNLMKSYTVTPARLADVMLELEKYGADIVYIVDSAGGMLPTELKDYINQVREKSPTLRLAFHGHNNLGMAVANALVAVELDVEIIDTTLLGLGRSSGNVPTEQFLCVLMRKGILLNCDPIAVMDIAEKYIQPLMQIRNTSSIDLIAGFAFFHSSYMPIIEKYATAYRVDPRHLIMAVSACDKNNVSSELVEERAKYLSERNDCKGNWKSFYQSYYGNELQAT